MDRERLRLKRKSESPEARDVRLKSARAYKASEAGKKAMQKYERKSRARSNDNAYQVDHQSKSLEA